MVNTGDGLSSVFKGIERTGEAQIIGRGPGLAIADQILAKDRDEKQKRDKETADMAKLTSGSVTSKWSQTNFQEIMPKISEYRQQFGDVMRQIQNEKDPYKREILKQEYADKFNQLEELAKTDSQVYDEYQKYVDAYKKDPNKFDTEVEVNGRIYNVDEAQEVLANPYNVPELQEEIKKAGGVIPWRVQNWRKFVPEAAYSINEDIKSQGVKLDTWMDQDIKTIGGEKFWNIKKGIKPERLESTFTDFWERNSLKGEKFRKQMDKAVKSELEIVEDKNGNKILISDNPDMQAAIDNLMATKKKTDKIEDILPKLSREYGKVIFKNYHPTEEKPSRIPNYFQQQILKQTPGGGGANNQKITEPDFYNMAITPTLEKIRTSSMSLDEQFQEIAKALNFGDNSGSVKTVKLSNGGYVLELPSPPVKLGTDGKAVPFQFNGQNVLTMRGGYYQPAGSDKTFVGSIKSAPVIMFKDKNGVTSTPSDPTAIPYLQAIFTDADGNDFKVQYDLTNSTDRTHANQSMYYSSAGMNQFNTSYQNQNKQAQQPTKPTKRKPPVSSK
jgi:hypothetical protein